MCRDDKERAEITKGAELRFLYTQTPKCLALICEIDSTYGMETFHLPPQDLEELRRIARTGEGTRARMEAGALFDFAAWR